MTTRHYTTPTTDCIEIVSCIEALRQDDGSSVGILCPYLDGEPDEPVHVVVCCGAWTTWQEKRFGGDTLVLALQSALDQYNKRKNEKR